VTGARQVGKSTMVSQTLASWEADCVTSITTEPGELSLTGNERILLPSARRDAEWLVDVWKNSRAIAERSGHKHVLVIDEIQKVKDWSEIVKGLWDTDRANAVNLQVVLLGSAPLLMQKGMSESLAGRYEVIPLAHWSLAEMQAAFDFSLEEYLYFGGYPGAAKFIREEARWCSYVLASLVAPNIEKDILQMRRVEHPALLKKLFEAGCDYSGQIMSFEKIQGQLQHTGNKTTLADYLHLLEQAKLLVGLQKFASNKVRQRNSSPKLNVLNTALMTASSGYTFAEAQADRAYWGRLVESAVGAHLLNTVDDTTKITYWRKSPFEVDFILSKRDRVVALEVKSGKFDGRVPGVEKFRVEFAGAKALVIGNEAKCDVGIAEFLSYPAGHWIDFAFRDA
jgi:uncharacterized protein